MNKTKLKNYAPQARKDFIAAVTARANQLGLSSNGGTLVVSPVTRQGDVTLIEGRDWPAKVFGQRERLVKRMQHDGFEQVIEAVAYTWFNRFAALRYMELHDYLEHGYRVLSSSVNSEGKAHTPDILLHAVDLAQNQSLPGLNVDQIGRLKLAGNQDGELYRKLLIAQCNALSNAMPFLFERIDDETELLLPDNLLRTDSVIAKLVAEVSEEDWKEVEIIGWLYQFYISEKKDQVIGKVVKSQDIPAATQLFTPNWIVQYLVQNSVGRLWMMANPSSTLKNQWRYYTEPAEQTLEVNVQLDALIKTRMGEDGGSLNPESITVLDPACGSGHILVEAYELLKGIYLERGYRLRDIPRLILEKNLCGLDIDDRAAQMAGFALLMKARADDRRLLNAPPMLNVWSLQDSKGLELDELATHLGPVGIQRGTLKSLFDAFANAKTFGSLIQIPLALNEELETVAKALEKARGSGDMYVQAAVQDLTPLVEQALVLRRTFDAIVANPPYMGPKGMNSALKELAKAFYPDSKSDLFAMFIERGFSWCKSTGINSMVTMQSWMFLSSYEEMRNNFLRERTIISMAHLGARAFNEISGEVVQTTAFNALALGCDEYKSVFFRLVTLSEQEKKQALSAGENRFDQVSQNEFKKIPGSPIAYWIPDGLRSSFLSRRNVDSIAPPRIGMMTTDNERFLRYWYELNYERIGFGFKSIDEAKASGSKWFPYNKGGGYRKWAGFQTLVVNWGNGGQEIVDNGMTSFRGKDFYFKSGITWSDIATGDFSCRYTNQGHLFDIKGTSCFPEAGDVGIIGTVLNSKVGSYILNLLNPTMSYQSGDVRRVPIPDVLLNSKKDLNVRFNDLVNLSQADWDSSEVSWGFRNSDLTSNAHNHDLISMSWFDCAEVKQQRICKTRELEENNNRLFIEAYGLKDELSPDVADDQITLFRTDREKDCLRLISYAVGCMMGRYSLDQPGLIYAQAGNAGFDATRYQSFPADTDGIVPLTYELWFEDDASNRILEFLVAVWGSETFEENLAWLAESLGKKVNETPNETIRRYLSDKFFKDHLQTYKKRPIYWLFCSGKQGAFQALVYLHRYHEGTLARMRAEYVVPLTGKILARIEMLDKDAQSASSTAARNKINKEIEKLNKQHVELLAYDEKLRHYADMRIKLDLDDGVKANYGKFGDLLDSVKAITGGSDE